jgi:hypothetical protein
MHYFRQENFKLKKRHNKQNKMLRTEIEKKDNLFIQLTFLTMLNRCNPSTGTLVP